MGTSLSGQLRLIDWSELISIKLAFVTFSDANYANLSTVFFFEIVSKNFPSKIMVISAADISK